MLNVPSGVKNLFKLDSIYKNFRVHFPDGETTDFDNENIQQESVKFTESLCSQSVFKFGLAEASQIEFTAIGIPNILGMNIECGLDIDCTSLGDSWAAVNPFDPNKEWLAAQPIRKIISSGSQTGSSTTINVSDTTKMLDIVNVIASIKYSQSGVPSPSTPKQVTGRSSLNLVIGKTSYDPNRVTYNIPYGMTVAGAVLDVRGHRLTVNALLLTGLDALEWEAFSGNSDSHSFRCSSVIYNSVAVNAGYSPDGYACSHYVGRALFAITNYNYCFAIDQHNLVIRNVDYSNTSSANINTFKNSLQDVVLVYPLYAPQTYDLEYTFDPPRLTGSSTWYLTANGEATITVDYTLSDPAEKLYFRVPYGRFRVSSCPRNQGAMAFRAVTALTEMAYFKMNQYINGQHPSPTVKMNPYEWLEAYVGKIPKFLTANLSNAQLTDPDAQYWDSKIWSGGYDSNFNGVSLETGIVNPDCVIDFYNSPEFDNQLPLGTYVFKVHYEQNSMDNYADHLYEAAMAKIPSGDFLYGVYGGLLQPEPQAESTKQWFGVTSAGFKPSYFLAVKYKHGGDDVYFFRLGKPVIIESDKLYYIDLTHLSDPVYLKSVPSGYSLDNGLGRVTVSLVINVPFMWNNTAKWFKAPSSYTNVTNWVTGTPLASQSQIIRDGELDVYLKELADDTVFPRITVNNSLAFNKPDLGTYYTFANALSTTRMANGVLEMVGEFMRTNRAGDLEIYKLSDHITPVFVSASEWSEFWWDENEIDLIGTVEVLNGEDDAIQFTIGTGGSTYAMDDNRLLQTGQLTIAQITTILNQFVTQSGNLDFTPIELNMRGLPYLEAGDYIQLTADDGETVYTYILEQTITGIQNLSCAITSVNGEAVTYSVGEE